MADLWNAFIGWLANFVTPDWANLIAILPIGLALIVALFLVFVVAARFMAGPTRRGRRRMRPLPPPGVHAPAPSFAPLLVAIAVAILFFGVVFRGPVLAVGLLATVAALLYWGSEEIRNYRQVEAHDAEGSSLALAGYDASGLRPLESLAGPPLPRLAPPAPAPEPTAADVHAAHMPQPSFRPLLVSIAATVVFFGLVFGPAVLLAGVLMLVVALLGWLIDARADYRATVAAERTGHPVVRPAPRPPLATFAVFAVIFLFAVGFRAGILPPNIPAVPSPGQGSAAPAAQASTGGGSAAPSGGANGGGQATGDLKVTAQGIRFQETTLTAPANKGFTIAFNNQDSGIPHNIAIYKGSSASGQPVFEGAQFPGPASKTYTVAALQPGTYTFICQVHPQQMQGTLTVR